MFVACWRLLVPRAGVRPGQMLPEVELPFGMNAAIQIQMPGTRD